MNSSPRWLAAVVLTVLAGAVAGAGLAQRWGRPSPQPGGTPERFVPAQGLRRLPPVDGTGQHPGRRSSAASRSPAAGVAPASHRATLLATAAVGQEARSPMRLEAVTTTLDGLTLRWLVRGDQHALEMPIAGGKADYALHFRGVPAVNDQIRMKPERTPPPQVEDAGAGARRLVFSDAPGTRATFDLRAVVEGPQDLRITNATGLRLRVGSAAAQSPTPLAERVMTNRYADTPDIKLVENPTDDVPVYGGYLRLQIRSHAQLGPIRCAVFQEQTNQEYLFLDERVPTSDVAGSSNVRTTEIQLPVDQFSPGQRGAVLLFAERNGARYYAERLVRFQLQAAEAPAVAPRILKAEQLDDQGTPSGALRIDRMRHVAVRFPRLRLSGKAEPLRSLAQTEGARVVLYRGRAGRWTRVPIPGAKVDSQTTAWSLSWQEEQPGDYDYRAAIVWGNLEGPPSEVIRISYRNTGPHVVDIEPRGHQIGAGRIPITVYFSPEHPLNPVTAATRTNYEMSGAGVNARKNPLSATYQAATNSVQLVFPDYDGDGTYRLTIKKGPDVPPAAVTVTGLRDIFGLGFVGKDGVDHVEVFYRSRLADEPSVRPGIAHRSGEYVRFPEFTPPRATPSGFNPNDKVESRVARLYYFRDAHRVAQIINRKVRSYNRQGVDRTQQLADKARQASEQATAARKAAERAAIEKARRTRELESQLQAAQNALALSLQEIQRFQLTRAPAADANGGTPPVLQSLQAATARFQAQVETLQSQVAHARGVEARANDLVQQLEERERLAAEDRFRLETAAGEADPDTYAPGVPASPDPVEQVSVSVLGEGLIQLRGPLKGINIIRMMIDQIDSPVGQVRIGVHTVQINGEKAARMEKVADRVQKYIDHSRFLTTQSAEMLRKAVVHIAARKAEESRAQFGGETQADRDRRYLNAFFGKDFINELATLDSEFLRTGNKLLSLHSMDVTSLSSALNLMALAKNSTRLEILREFERLVHTELPAAEARYLEAGFACEKQTRRDQKRPFCQLAQNAKFESLKGFFNHEIAGDDVMTPLQREFIRLAQILKSRLVTELQYKQRVTERALIEDRFRNRDEERLQILQREKEANRDRLAALAALRAAQRKVEDAALAIQSRAAILQPQLRRLQQDVAASSQATRQLVTQIEWQDKEDREKVAELLAAEQPAANVRETVTTMIRQEGRPHSLRKGIMKAPSVDVFKALKTDVKLKAAWEKQFKRKLTYSLIWGDLQFEIQTRRGADGEVEEETVTPVELRSKIDKRLRTERRALGSLHKMLEQFQYLAEDEESLQDGARLLRDLSSEPMLYIRLQQLHGAHEIYFRLANLVTHEYATVITNLKGLVAELGQEESDVVALYRRWLAFQQDLTSRLRGGPLQDDAQRRFREIESAFRVLMEARRGFSIADQNAAESRRQLDHVKFLDLLIDDLEEKLIELLEGTRAHTANIDNYVKRITTALDDDFNTQFYYPAMRLVREASTYYDVQFGQTETTTLLANNRMFAKVEPSATMEFDLPERDILLTEAMNGAKALIDEVGALAADPTFLAAARMHSGSTATPAPGSTGGYGVVRSVLPGLSTDSTEQVLAQNANGGRQFGSQLENLIPDPAIYKFETGTGFEIRPVIQPDGQAVVFDFNYLYSTQIREPVRADEKHLGRVKQHYVHTDVQLSNFEMREVSRYTVALKAARTANGVPLLEDIPGVGVLFRPLPSQESSLQQNLIMAQATIFPTLFDLMNLRWAPAVADLDPLRLSKEEHTVRGRQRLLQNRVYDFASQKVDEFLQIPQVERRPDLYRTQETVPYVQPDGTRRPGLDLRRSRMKEGYPLERLRQPDRYAPARSAEGAPLRTAPPLQQPPLLQPGGRQQPPALPPANPSGRPHTHPPVGRGAAAPRPVRQSALVRQPAPAVERQVSGRRAARVRTLRRTRLRKPTPIAPLPAPVPATTAPASYSPHAFPSYRR